MIYEGRRRETQPDDRLGGIPHDLKPGDYWKARVQQGTQIKEEWWICVPGDGIHIGRIPNHTVIEHEDGTITVMPDQARDGHMNSILVTQRIHGVDQQIFHGWIKRGKWSEDWQELQREVSD